MIYVTMLCVYVELVEIIYITELALFLPSSTLFTYQS